MTTLIAQIWKIFSDSEWGGVGYVFCFSFSFGFGGEGCALCWRIFIWETEKGPLFNKPCPKHNLTKVLLPEQMINNISWYLYIQEITNKLDTQNMVFFTISKASHYPPTNLACTTQEEN